MNGDLPDSNQVTAIAICGICLGLGLIAFGYRHDPGKPSGVPPTIPMATLAAATFEVHGTRRLVLHQAPPLQREEKDQTPPSLPPLPQGTRVRKVAERACKQGVWFQVQICEGPASGLEGWVDSRFLRSVRN